MKCCLCDKETDEKLELYVGGCLTYTHKSCVNIVKKYIERLENYEGIIKRVNSSLLKDRLNKARQNNEK